MQAHFTTLVPNVMTLSGENYKIHLDQCGIPKHKE